jgi:hypothetical protein
MGIMNFHSFLLDDNQRSSLPIIEEVEEVDFSGVAFCKPSINFKSDCKLSDNLQKNINNTSSSNKSPTNLVVAPGSVCIHNFSGIPPVEIIKKDIPIAPKLPSTVEYVSKITMNDINIFQDKIIESNHSNHLKANVFNNGTFQYNNQKTVYNNTSSNNNNLKKYIKPLSKETVRQTRESKNSNFKKLQDSLSDVIDVLEKEILKNFEGYVKVFFF